MNTVRERGITLVASNSLADCLHPEDAGDMFLRILGSYNNTLRHIPEDDILRSYRSENLKSYNKQHS
jgi:hypothetical protein